MYLDIWNLGSPTVMIMKVAVSVNGQEAEVLAPQRRVQSGDIDSINVAYQVLGQVSQSTKDLTPPPDSAVSVRFTVTYFSTGGERAVSLDCDLWFMVTENQLFAFVNKEMPAGHAWGTHSQGAFDNSTTSRRAGRG